MKIKVKLFNPLCRFTSIKKGEWIDLHANGTYNLEGPYANVLSSNRKKRGLVFTPTLIKLGIGMQLPPYLEAYILPRSSTYNVYKSLLTNSQGVIDSSYAGPDDEWKFQALPFEDKVILEGERICQFRLQLSQKATIWQKIKWLFTNKIEFEFVDNYEGINRGGFGSTGV